VGVEGCCVVEGGFHIWSRGRVGFISPAGPCFGNGIGGRKCYT
jgi:hypothetical protein